MLCKDQHKRAYIKFIIIRKTFLDVRLLIPLPPTAFRILGFFNHSLFSFPFTFVPLTDTIDVVYINAWNDDANLIIEFVPVVFLNNLNNIFYEY